MPIILSQMQYPASDSQQLVESDPVAGSRQEGSSLESPVKESRGVCPGPEAPRSSKETGTNKCGLR